MGIFDFFGNRPDFSAGLETFQASPGAVLLDVRTPEEYRSGHVPGSVNLPLDRLSSRQFSPDTPLFVYCLSGARSAQACAWLSRQGCRTVRNLGGITSYRGPVERGGSKS
jgi:phage shock protein E